MAVESVSVFFSYSHKDEGLRNDLDVHLAPLRRGKLISSWHDRKIAVGTAWDAEISAQMQAADIIVLLLSPDFLASDYCNDTEIPAALARHASGDAIVIPVVLRPFNWFGSPVAHLQSIPRDKKAVTTWADRDEAFVNVAEGIREEASRMLELRRQQALQRETTHQRYQMKVVEMLSDGRVSLVERETLDELMAELKLSPAEAAAIEARAAEPYKKYGDDLEKYRRTLQKVIAQAYPIPPAMQEDLKLRRRDLGLKDEDADRIEASVLAQAEADLRARLAAPAGPAAASPAPAVASPAPAAAPVPTPASRSGPVPAPIPAPTTAPTTAATVAATAPTSAAAAHPSHTDFGNTVLAALVAVGKHDDLFVLPNIPAAKLANARRTCKVPADDEVLGLLDLTVFGSASDALLLGRQALYYHNDAGTPEDHLLPWASPVLRVAGFAAPDSSHLVCPGGVSLYVNCAFETVRAAVMLEAIRQGRINQT